MPLQRFDCDAPAVIGEHSAAFADAVTARLGAAVPSCPGWRVRDLVEHVMEVHWFWATIVEERLSAPPDESRRPAAPDDGGKLIAALRAGADRLVAVLAAADSATPVWTWAPAQQDAGFVLRHQVQEIVVHHWDAAAATGAGIVIEPAAAADAVDEFLTFSVSSDAEPGEPARRALDGELGLRCSDVEAAWLVRAGSQPGTVAATFVEPAALSVPALEAPAADLLLWLYRRIDLDTEGVDDGLLRRFAALTRTD